MSCRQLSVLPVAMNDTVVTQVASITVLLHEIQTPTVLPQSALHKPDNLCFLHDSTRTASLQVFNDAQPWLLQEMKSEVCT